MDLQICLSYSCSLFTLCKSCFACDADYQANLRAVLGHVRGPAQGPPQEQLHAQGRGCALSGAKLAEVLGGLVEILYKKGRQEWKVRGSTHRWNVATSSISGMVWLSCSLSNRKRSIFSFPNIDTTCHRNCYSQGWGRMTAVFLDYVRSCMYFLTHLTCMTMLAAGQQDHDRDPAAQPGRPRGEEVRLLGRSAQN